jgi:hypothetical protein
LVSEEKRSHLRQVSCQVTPNYFTTNLKTLTGVVMKKNCFLILFAFVWLFSAAHAEVPVSKYGTDDTLGAINNLSPQKVLQATRLVKHGKTYRLGVTTGSTSPAYPPRSFSMTVLQLDDGTGTPLGTNKATGNDDLMNLWMGIGSQIDGLGHMG